MLKEKSLPAKAISMIATQAVSRRAEGVDGAAARGRPSGDCRCGRRGRVAAARTAARKASASRTLPRLAITLGRELRRALGDQRFRFADEGAALHRAGEDDLAAAAERIGDGARCR